MPSSKCIVCGKEFSASAKTVKYCSPECRHSAVFSPVAATCSVCGKEFTALSARAKYCSAVCKNNTKKEVIKKCKGCSCTFVTTESKQIFCTVACALKFTEIRKIIICARCGKEVEHIGRGYRSYCSDCRKLVNKEIQQRAYENIHKRRPAYFSEGVTREETYQEIGYRLYGNTCAICGKTGDSHVHHIDGNRRNQTPSNLCVLCPNCHNYTHGRVRGSKDALELAMALIRTLLDGRLKIAEKIGNPSEVDAGQSEVKATGNS